MGERQRQTRKERRSEQRAQGKVAENQARSFSPLRRRLIIAGGLGLAIIAVATPLAINYYLHHLDEIEHSPTPTLEHLRQLDSSIKGDAGQLEKLAPVIGEMAINYFCGELGYQRNQFPGTYHYEWQDDYIKNRDAEKYCSNSTDPIDQAAYTNLQANDTHFNLTRFFHDGSQISKLSATKLFSLALHEAHHNKAPFLDVNPPQETPDDSSKLKLFITKRRGFVVTSPNTKDKLPGRECYYTGFVPLDEAVVEDSTRRMINKLGFSLKNSYDKWVDIYRSQIVDRFFNRNYLVPLRMHQRSDEVGFFSEIGRQLGSGQQRALSDLEVGQIYVGSLPW